MRDRLNGVLAFVQAADAGSFALAARHMSLSRSAVGKSIARLEQQLGTRLFHRTTRNQTLTEDGQIFYERCVRALAEIEAAEATLESGRRAPRGTLRVSVPVLFGRYCVAPVLLEITRRYPLLQLDLSFTDRVVDLVEENFDLAVRVAPLASSSGLISRRTRNLGPAGVRLARISGRAGQASDDRGSQYARHHHLRAPLIHRVLAFS